jgi:glycosyltransferase involved in cell wall biosynthesis
LKTIALVDSSAWRGHRPTYLKIFSQTLLDLGYRVIALCSNPTELEQWIATHAPAQSSQFSAQFLCEPTLPKRTLPVVGSTTYRWRRWQEAASAVQAVAKTGWVPDLVFFPWLDSFLGNLMLPIGLDRQFPYLWSGLYFHPTHLRTKHPVKQNTRWRPNVDVALMSAHCRAVTVLDEGIAKRLSHKLHDKPIVVFPDFTDQSPPDRDYDLCQRIVKTANKRPIIGALGSLAKRKGLLALLEVAKRSPEWFFVFAGQLAKQDLTPAEDAILTQAIESPPENCFFHVERIPTEEKFNAIVSICDVLFAVYENFPHSSNILTKAAIAQKPVVVSRNYCMGDRVEKFRLGVTVNEGQVSEYIEALHFLCDSESQGLKRLNPEFEAYRLRHSTDQLRTAMKDLLAQYFG